MTFGAPSAHADADAELYAKWKRTQLPSDLEALVKNLNPLIQAEVNRRSGTLSRELLVIQAKKLTVDAIRRRNGIPALIGW